MYRTGTPIDLADRPEPRPTLTLPRAAVLGRLARWRPGPLPRPHLWALAAVTLFAGWLRFYNLEFPALWNDETLVFWRVCGSYGELLVPLRTDGFPPLHYSLYWLLGHPVPVGPDALQPVAGILVLIAVAAAVTIATAVAVRRDGRTWVRASLPAATAIAFAVLAWVVVSRTGTRWLWPQRWLPAAHTMRLTPWVMRSVVAISGTLTVPAMYFLARQLVPPGTAVVAALVTACSTFMLFYSRDAKMYADVWLLITLNVGCLLWWFRTGNSTAYLAWIAAGVGAVGLHSSAYAIPAISVVFLLTQRQLRWPRAVLFLLGVCVIYSGIAVYFTKFNLWNERVEAIGWQASGLTWVGGFFNGERTGPEHLWYATTSFLAGYEWPRQGYLRLIEPSLAEVPQAVSLAVAGLLVVAAAVPGPLLRTLWRPDRQAARDAAAPEPAWRLWLWLGVWIAVPTYAIYCRSVDGFAGPRRWAYELQRAVNPIVWAVAGGAVLTLVGAAVPRRSLRPMVTRLISFWVVTVVLFAACWALFAFMWPAAGDAWLAERPWQSIWEPRYLGFMWPAVGVGVAALLMRLPTRPVRVAAVAFFCGANLLMFALRMTLTTEPPIDTLAADTWAAQPRPDGTASTTRTYDNVGWRANDARHREGIEVAATSLGTMSRKIAGGRYYLQMLADRRPMGPALFEQSLARTFHTPYTLRQDLPPAAVRKDLAGSPQVDRVVLWSQLMPGERLTFDPYRSALPAGFRLAREEVFPVRVIWDWREYWKWVRREYVRPAGPRSGSLPSR